MLLIRLFEGIACFTEASINKIDSQITKSTFSALEWVPICGISTAGLCAFGPPKRECVCMMQVIKICTENIGDLLHFYMHWTPYVRLQNVGMLYLFWTLTMSSLYIPGPLNPNVLSFHHGWCCWICLFDKEISCCLFYHCCVLLIKWCVSAEQRFWSEHGNRYIWLIN